MRHADMWKTAITCWIWTAVTHSVFSAKAWGEISNRSKLDHTVTVNGDIHLSHHLTFSNCNFKDLHRSHGLDGPSQKGKTSPAHSMCMSPRLPARGSRGWGRSRSSWWFSRDWIVCSGVQLNQINRKWEYSHSRWWACRDERLSRIFQKPSFEAD